jgi:FkbM family methyltransferase
MVTTLGVNDRVTTHREALGLHSGRSSMSVPFWAGLPVHGRSFVTDGAIADGPNAVEFSSSRRVPVEVTTLDAFCEREQIDRLDFIKADVEGAERRVLGGGQATLDRHRPILQLEIEQAHIAKYGTDAGELVEFLRGRDYRMHGWDGDRWTPAASVTPDRHNYLFMPASPATPG